MTFWKWRSQRFPTDQQLALELLRARRAAAASPRRRTLRLAGLFAITLFLSSLGSRPAHAFPHVVQEGDTLAELAERFYGRIQLERVVATANALEGGRSPSLTPGMILQIPAVTYHQVGPSETWKSLATQHLGHVRRHILLAQVNGSKPWLEPELGQIIRIPYNLAWQASGEESLATLAYRFLGSTKHAFRLVQYNDLGEDGPQAGEVLLIPLSDLSLTQEGRRAANGAASRLSKQAQGQRYAQQKNSQLALRKLTEDVLRGRYISAVQRGTRLLAAGELPIPERARIHRQLLESFVALEARAKARASCQAHLDLAETPDLDPLMTSPKILEACQGLSPAPQPSEAKATKASPKIEEETN